MFLDESKHGVKLAADLFQGITQAKPSTLMSIVAIKSDLIKLYL